MTADNDNEDGEFIRRWSRRKQAAKATSTAEMETAAKTADEKPESGDSPDAADSAETEQPAIELPDIETMTTESDFSQFLKDGVPEDLKNRALRKLWRINPVYGIRDGLNDYDGDFTDSATVVKGLKTLYKVGRGFLAEPKPEADENIPPNAEPEAASLDPDEPTDAPRQEPAAESEQPDKTVTESNKIT